MKTCTRCKVDKNLTEFHKGSKNLDGLARWCKKCSAEYDRLRYVTGDKARKDRNKKLRQSKSQELIWNILCQSACKDCGITDPLVLEFDHMDDSSKSYNISEMYSSFKTETILKEIAKCEIRCANCHRKRTIIQLGMWRGNRNIA